MIVRHPFVEPPYACDCGDAREKAHLRDALTHYDLDNGYTVSVRHVEGFWEAWAFITGTPIRAGARTRRPVVCKDEHNALCYRDAIRKLPNAKEANPQ